MASAILSGQRRPRLVAAKAVRIAGAMYDLASAKVEFLT
jgi:hypothetical protein